MDEQGRYQRSTNMEIACGKFGYGPVRSEYMQCEQATPHGDTEGIDREDSVEARFGILQQHERT